MSPHPPLPPPFLSTLIYTCMSDNNLTGYLVKCVNDIKILVMRIISAKETTQGNITNNRRLLVTLMEPTIEYIMKCIFKDASQVYAEFHVILILPVSNPSVW